MSVDYPWYKIIQDSSLQQGDFFFSLKKAEPIFEKDMRIGESTSLQTTASEYDVIIISQSCDLDNGKIESVLTAPVVSLDQFPVKSKDSLENIRKGNAPGYHMINACDLESFVAPIRIVNFRQVFSIPFSYCQYLADNIRPRLRLLPPYREHLSQSFARFIMRVGLPVDIPRF